MKENANSRKMMHAGLPTAVYCPVNLQLSCALVNPKRRDAIAPLVARVEKAPPGAIWMCRG